MDADTGASIAQVRTTGRVITGAIFNDSKTVLYVGTEKAMVHAFDAFSYLPIFSFAADSKIHNNLIIWEDAVVFSSAVGTVYSIDQRSGHLNWEVKQPLAHERLRLSSNSNIILREKKANDSKAAELIVPHADGYLSVIDARSGQVKKKLSLGTSRPKSFPDIVAPMVIFRNQLWVASYDLGLFVIDMAFLQIREHHNISEISQLASDGEILLAATPNWLMAISGLGAITWKNNLASITTKLSLLGYPFERNLKQNRRLFFGTPSRLLIRENYGDVILASSFGSMGVFDRSTGQLLKILGNSVGFGPNIDWAGSKSIAAMSRRGLLMKFQFSSGGEVDKDIPTTAFGPL